MTTIKTTDVRNSTLKIGDVIQITPGHLHTVTGFSREEVVNFKIFEARMNGRGDEIGIDGSRAGTMDDSVRDGKVAVLESEEWSEDGEWRYTSGPVVSIRGYRV